MSRLFRIVVVMAILIGVLSTPFYAQASIAGSAHSSTVYAANYSAFTNKISQQGSHISASATGLHARHSAMSSVCESAIALWLWFYENGLGETFLWYGELLYQFCV